MKIVKQIIGRYRVQVMSSYEEIKGQNTTQLTEALIKWLANNQSV